VASNPDSIFLRHFYQNLLVFGPSENVAVVLGHVWILPEEQLHKK
jgi:hypothetical protein